MSTDPLRDIQLEVASYLSLDPYLADLDLVTEQRGDVLAAIERALGKAGIVIVVETITGRPEYQGIGAYALDLKLAITVTERPFVNQGSKGTGKPSSAVVARILCLLNPMRVGVPAWPESFALVNDMDNLLVYLINCKAAAGFEIDDSET